MGFDQQQNSNLHRSTWQNSTLSRLKREFDPRTRSTSCLVHRLSPLPSFRLPFCAFGWRRSANRFCGLESLATQGNSPSRRPAVGSSDWLDGREPALSSRRGFGFTLALLPQFLLAQILPKLFVSDAAAQSSCGDSNRCRHLNWTATGRSMPWALSQRVPVRKVKSATR